MSYSSVGTLSDGSRSSSPASLLEELPNGEVLSADPINFSKPIAPVSTTSQVVDKVENEKKRVKTILDHQLNFVPTDEYSKEPPLQTTVREFLLFRSRCEGEPLTLYGSARDYVVSKESLFHYHDIDFMRNAFGFLTELNILICFLAYLHRQAIAERIWEEKKSLSFYFSEIGCAFGWIENLRRKSNEEIKKLFIQAYTKELIGSKRDEYARRIEHIYLPSWSTEFKGMIRTPSLDVKLASSRDFIFDQEAVVVQFKVEKGEIIDEVGLMSNYRGMRSLDQLLKDIEGKRLTFSHLEEIRGAIFRVVRKVAAGYTIEDSLLLFRRIEEDILAMTDDHLWDIRWKVQLERYLQHHLKDEGKEKDCFFINLRLLIIMFRSEPLKIMLLERINQVQGVIIDAEKRLLSAFYRALTKKGRYKYKEEGNLIETDHGFYLVPKPFHEMVFDLIKRSSYPKSEILSIYYSWIGEAIDSRQKYEARLYHFYQFLEAILYGQEKDLLVLDKETKGRFLAHFIKLQPKYNRAFSDPLFIKDRFEIDLTHLSSTKKCDRGKLTSFFERLKEIEHLLLDEEIQKYRHILQKLAIKDEEQASLQDHIGVIYQLYRDIHHNEIKEYCTNKPPKLYFDLLCWFFQPSELLLSHFPERWDNELSQWLLIEPSNQPEAHFKHKVLLLFGTKESFRRLASEAQNLCKAAVLRQDPSKIKDQKAFLLLQRARQKGQFSFFQAKIDNALEQSAYLQSPDFSDIEIAIRFFQLASNPSDQIAKQRMAILDKARLNSRCWSKEGSLLYLEYANIQEPSIEELRKDPFSIRLKLQSKNPIRQECLYYTLMVHFEHLTPMEQLEGIASCKEDVQEPLLAKAKALSRSRHLQFKEAFVLYEALSFSKQFSQFFLFLQDWVAPEFHLTLLAEFYPYLDLSPLEKVLEKISLEERSLLARFFVYMGHQLPDEVIGSLFDFLLIHYKSLKKELAPLFTDFALLSFVKGASIPDETKLIKMYGYYREKRASRLFKGVNFTARWLDLLWFRHKIKDLTRKGNEIFLKILLETPLRSQIDFENCIEFLLSLSPPNIRATEQLLTETNGSFLIPIALKHRLETKFPSISWEDRFSLQQMSSQDLGNYIEQGALFRDLQSSKKIFWTRVDKIFENSQDQKLIQLFLDFIISHESDMTARNYSALFDQVVEFVPIKKDNKDRIIDELLPRLFSKQNCIENWHVALATYAPLMKIFSLLDKQHHCRWKLFIKLLSFRLEQQNLVEDKELLAHFKSFWNSDASIRFFEEIASFIDMAIKQLIKRDTKGTHHLAMELLIRLDGVDLLAQEQFCEYYHQLEGSKEFLETDFDLFFPFMILAKKRKVAVSKEAIDHLREEIVFRPVVSVSQTFLNVFNEELSKEERALIALVILPKVLEQKGLKAFTLKLIGLLEEGIKEEHKPKIDDLLKRIFESPPTDEQIQQSLLRFLDSLEGTLFFPGEENFLQPSLLSLIAAIKGGKRFEECSKKYLSNVVIFHSRLDEKRVRIIAAHLFDQFFISTPLVQEATVFEYLQCIERWFQEGAFESAVMTLLKSRSLHQSQDPSSLLAPLGEKVGSLHLKRRHGYLVLLLDSLSPSLLLLASREEIRAFFDRLINELIVLKKESQNNLWGLLYRAQTELLKENQISIASMLNLINACHQTGINDFKMPNLADEGDVGSSFDRAIELSLVAICHAMHPDFETEKGLLTKKTVQSLTSSDQPSCINFLEGPFFELMIRRNKTSPRVDLIIDLLESILHWNREEYYPYIADWLFRWWEEIPTLDKEKKHLTVPSGILYNYRFFLRMDDLCYRLFFLEKEGAFQKGANLVNFNYRMRNLTSNPGFVAQGELIFSLYNSRQKMVKEVFRPISKLQQAFESMDVETKLGNIQLEIDNLSRAIFSPIAYALFLSHLICSWNADLGPDEQTDLLSEAIDCALTKYEKCKDSFLGKTIIEALRHFIQLQKVRQNGELKAADFFLFNRFFDFVILTQFECEIIDWSILLGYLTLFNDYFKDFLGSNTKTQDWEIYLTVFADRVGSLYDVHNSFLLKELMRLFQSISHHLLDHFTSLSKQPIVKGKMIQAPWMRMIPFIKTIFIEVIDRRKEQLSQDIFKVLEEFIQDETIQQMIIKSISNNFELYQQELEDPFSPAIDLLKQEWLFLLCICKTDGLTFSHKEAMQEFFETLLGRIKECNLMDHFKGSQLLIQRLQEALTLTFLQTSSVVLTE